MDTIKIGKFISELRHEKGFTQEQLGEKIGVTNKTISRWENGNYLPSIDMLKLLSEEFSVTINELLYGEKISDSEYREKSDEIIENIAKSDIFSLREKYNYWKTKWIKEHKFLIILCIIIPMFLIIISIVIEWDILLCFIPIILILVYIFLYNKCMSYVDLNP